MFYTRALGLLPLHLLIVFSFSGPTNSNYGEESKSLKLGSVKDIEHDINLFIQAYDAACWYESRIGFSGITSLPLYDLCLHKVVRYHRFLTKHPNFYAEKDQAEFLHEMNKYWDKHLTTEELYGWFWLFPEEYITTCDLEKRPDLSAFLQCVDYSMFLNDTHPELGSNLLANCLLYVLENRAGIDILHAWKAYRLNKNKDWRKILLAKTNTMRSLHGSGALKMTDNLNNEAQQAADEQARNCSLEKNGETSESVGGSYHTIADVYDLGDAGLIAISRCCWQINKYNFPDEVDSQPEEVSGPTDCFTALVWKSTINVGYGVSCNEECFGNSTSECYVVIKYSPYGNTPNLFQENVPSPKD